MGGRKTGSKQQKTLFRRSLLSTLHHQRSQHHQYDLISLWLLKLLTNILCCPIVNPFYHVFWRLGPQRFGWYVWSHRGKLLCSTYYIFFLYFVLYLVMTTCGVMPQVLWYHHGFQHHGLYIKPAGVTCTYGNGVCTGMVWQVTGVVSPVLYPSHMELVVYEWGISYG